MRRPRPLRVLATLASTALLTAALTACGGGGSDSTADQAAPEASESTSAAAEPSETAEPSDAGNADDAGEPSEAGESEDAEEPEGDSVDVEDFVARMQRGVADTESAHVTFEIGAATGTMSGEGDIDYTTKPPSMQMSMDLGGQQMQMVMLDGAMYLQTPAADKWIQFDLDDPNNPIGTDLADQMDPAASTARMVEALKEVRSLGEDEVDGEPCDSYRMTIDGTKLADGGTAGMPAELEVDVCVDGDDRTRRTEMDLGSAGSYVGTLSNVNEPVTIKAPSADQIMTMPTPSAN